VLENIEIDADIHGRFPFGCAVTIPVIAHSWWRSGPTRPDNPSGITAQPDQEKAGSFAQSFPVSDAPIVGLASVSPCLGEFVLERPPGEISGIPGEENGFGGLVWHPVILRLLSGS